MPAFSTQYGKKYVSQAEVLLYIKVSSLKTTQDKELIFVSKEQSGKQYAIPSAFGAYAKYIKEETTR